MYKTLAYEQDVFFVFCFFNYVNHRQPLPNCNELYTVTVTLTIGTLHCSALPCTALKFTKLYDKATQCTELNLTALHCIELHCTEHNCNELEIIIYKLMKKKLNIINL